MTQTETGKAANNKKLYMFYHQLHFLLLHIKRNTSTFSNISAPAGTQNDAELADTLDQTDNSTAEDSKIGIGTTASPTTVTNVALSPSKRKRKNLHNMVVSKCRCRRTDAVGTLCQRAVGTLLCK